MVGWSSFSLRATACNASLVSIRFPTLLCVLIRWDEKAGLHGMRYAPNDRRARGTMKRRPAMKKISTVRVNGNMIFKGHKLTIGVDLGDRWSCYCVLDEAGEILLEQKWRRHRKRWSRYFRRYRVVLLPWRPEHILLG